MSSFSFSGILRILIILRATTDDIVLRSHHSFLFAAISVVVLRSLRSFSIIAARFIFGLPFPLFFAAFMPWYALHDSFGGPSCLITYPKYPHLLLSITGVKSSIVPVFVFSALTPIVSGKITLHTFLSCLWWKPSILSCSRILISHISELYVRIGTTNILNLCNRFDKVMLGFVKL